MRLSEITPELLTEVQDILAEGASGECRVVWESRKLVQFSAANAEARPSMSAVVEVLSLSAEDLEPLYAKLEEVDPMGSKRLVRD